MGFLQKAVSAMVTKYGTVTDGKYAGHTLCLGHDPDKKASPQVVNALAPKMFEQVIFMMDDEGKARHSIVDDVKLVSRIDEDDKTITLRVVWKTEEESTFRVFKEKGANTEQSGLAKGVGMLMKMGGTTKNSGSPESVAKERYGDCVDFLYSFVLVMDAETAEEFQSFANEAGYIPANFMELIEKAVSWVRSHAED
ncbi:MAG: hypothetical protein IJB27_07665 [Clostridia bacterium]|nr:hypothetical protein [Clostridia bacterium]